MTVEDPFATFSTVENGGIVDHSKELVLVWPREHQTGIKTKFGDDKDAIRADWVVLSGENAGDYTEDGLIFQGQMIGSLKTLAKKNYRVNGEKGDASRADLRPFLGRISQGTDKSKGNPPWIFLDPTDADRATAIQWLADNKPTDEPPF